MHHVQVWGPRGHSTRPKGNLCAGGLHVPAPPTLSPYLPIFISPLSLHLSTSCSSCVPPLLSPPFAGPHSEDKYEHLKSTKKTKHAMTHNPRSNMKTRSQNKNTHTFYSNQPT
mmetsp:Transcript_138142/g.240159  ORF Transcript_138142/g.240159 Transcript_138142/m.240159 type:complete len:113 (+) Transcript_138142:521-859(+)